MISTIASAMMFSGYIRSPDDLHDTSYRGFVDPWAVADLYKCILALNQSTLAAHASDIDLVNLFRDWRKEIGTLADVHKPWLHLFDVLHAVEVVHSPYIYVAARGSSGAFLCVG